MQSQNVVAHVMLPGMGELRVFTRFMAVYPVVTAACAVSGIRVAAGSSASQAGTATSMLVMELAFLARRRADALRRVDPRALDPLPPAGAEGARAGRRVHRSRCRSS